MHSTHKLTLLGLVVMGATALVTAGILRAATPQDAPDQDEIMKKYLEAATPGKPHQHLARCCGSWTVVVRDFCSGPEAQESAATAEFKAILGGRFVIQKFHGDMGGHPFEGFQILGYDNVARKYGSVWLDNWSTGIHTSEGLADDKGCVRMQGLMKDVLTPAGRPFRSAWTPDGDDRFTIELWQTVEGKESRMMEMVYTRKQP